MQSESQAIVEQLCQMYGVAGQGEDKQLLETPLNQQVFPLLRQYWGIHKALSQCFQVRTKIICLITLNMPTIDVVIHEV